MPFWSWSSTWRRSWVCFCPRWLFHRLCSAVLHLQDSTCDCGGPWAQFQKLFNFTLAHSPSGSGPFGLSLQPLEVLCYKTALPLARSVLGNIMHPNGALKYENLGTMTSSKYLDFGAYWCPSGLVSALSLCAAVHAESAKEQELLVRPGVRPRADPEETEGPGPVNWATALGAWPELIPKNCEKHFSCLAYLEGIVALTTLRHCETSITEMQWFIPLDEVNENVIRWLRWLWHRGASTVPPSWQGSAAKARVHPAVNTKAAGAFAGQVLGAPEDGTGATALLRNLAAAWGPQKFEFQGMSVRQRHFERIFGGLADLPTMNARGIGGVEVQSHPDDFRGRRSHLRFYLYELPTSVHSKMLEYLHGKVRTREATPAVCNLGLRPCSETHNTKGVFNSLRPFVAEATFLAKLLSGPDEIFVEDPSEASYFVVPFLSSMWCTLSGPFCWVRCSSQRPLNALLPFLTFYNASTAHRHLFLGSDSVGDLPQDLQMQPLVLHYGPSPCGSTGPLITPPTITDDLPSLGRWDFTSKDLLLFMADGVFQRPFRAEVLGELEKWQRRLPHLFAVSRREQGSHGGGHGEAPSLPSEVLWAEEMRRAIFCPVMPGDNTFRMRLFHAVLVGCIPVVILFPGGSWYRNQGPAVNASLPFPERIAWSQLSIELPFDPNTQQISTWAKQLVPKLLRMNIHELWRKQLLGLKSLDFLAFMLRVPLYFN